MDEVFSYVVRDLASYVQWACVLHDIFVFGYMSFVRSEDQWQSSAQDADARSAAVHDAVQEVRNKHAFN